MDPHHVGGIVMRHRLISSVCELFRGLEEFSAERRNILAEKFLAFLTLP